MRRGAKSITGLVGVALMTASVGLAAPVAYADEYDDDEHDLELGARVGATTGGGVTPGGARLSGTMLYRMSEIDWFEGGLSVVVGSGDPDCFTDRQGSFVCDHGPVDGRVGELSLGVRRYLIPGEFFSPYASLRVAARIISFPGDDVRGLALPALIGAGVRARVSRFVSVHGGATLEAGVGFMGRDIGTVPQLALSIYMGAEFALF